MKRFFLTAALALSCLTVYYAAQPQPAAAFGICDEKCADLYSCEPSINTICVAGVPFLPCETGICDID